MISVDCDNCKLPMNPLRGSKDLNGYHEQVYECKKCNVLLEVKFQKKIPDWGEITEKASGYVQTPWQEDDDKDVCDCCDGSCKEPIGQCDDYKHPICPVCEECHGGICEGFKEEEPVPREDSVVISKEDYEEKCCAAESPVKQQPIAELEKRVKRLELQKQMLDLNEYIYHARERERHRE